MFFIGVFGIQDKQEIIRTIDNINCPRCREIVTGKLIKEYSFFHFFFIPLFKWNESYYLLCNNCNAVYGISKEKGKGIEKGEDINITYWDLQNTDFTKSDYNYYNNSVCPRCGKNLEDNFDFCPYCGEKIRRY